MWFNDDPISRGVLDLCPECGERTLHRGKCDHCGYDDYEDDWPEEHWRDGLD